MGLCLCVGFAADLKENDPEGYEDFKAEIAKVNATLRAQGLPEHHEPDEVGAADFISLDMMGYSGLHYLRRIAAHISFTGKLPPPGDSDSSKDALLGQYYMESIQEKAPNGLALFKKAQKSKAFEFNHLLHHSDCEGYYLPMEFTNVIFPDPKLKVPGEMIGSAHYLLRECKRLAETLAIPECIDAASAELWDAANNQGQGDGWHRYGVESFTCVRLMRACEASIRSGAALVFA